VIIPGIQAEFLTNYQQQMLSQQSTNTSPRNNSSTPQHGAQSHNQTKSQPNSFDAPHTQKEAAARQEQTSSSFQSIDCHPQLQSSAGRCSPQKALFAVQDDSRATSESHVSSRSHATGGVTVSPPRQTSTPKTSHAHKIVRTPYNNNNSTSSATSLSNQGSDPSSSGGDDWVGIEDDLIICMQNAINDKDFARTETWLKKSNSKRGLVKVRTAEDAKARYAELCSTGRTETRLQDYKIRNTINTLKKSVALNVQGVTSLYNSSKAGGLQNTYTEEQRVEQNGSRSNGGTKGGGGKYFSGSPTEAAKGQNSDGDNGAMYSM
jgi:hypothetical protein